MLRFGRISTASTSPAYVRQARHTQARFPTPLRTNRRTVSQKQSRLNSGETGETGAIQNDGLNYGKLLLAIADANPYLSDGSRQALTTTANLAIAHQSKLTVLVVDEDGKGDPMLRYKIIDEKLQSLGCPFNLLARNLDSKCSAILGDVVDEINADLLVLSSDTVHVKTVDANLLAEFVSCPVLLLP